ncbi:VOC family protein [Tessaracoccus sp. MC1756]|uniref:VOC family protein n=1 Tax=Tessaracoccus sp. MC1756 TaxID=2760311 RepID=UPI001601490A|nr:VOC family protein [Tessaracoccus sp. MC1756]MBB1509584.1 VOC family protein [Tessaracoccus sp. MC1756]
MNRVTHFEIHAGDVPRAVDFYRSVFGWAIEDWSEFAGMPYMGVVTREEGTPGINGAIMQRMGDNPSPGSPVAGSVITVEVDDFDAAGDRIVRAGGAVAMPKYALPGMAWQGYFVDTEGNVFGVHQPDEAAGVDAEAAKTDASH